MILSTEGIAKNQVFEYWNDYICNVFVNLEAQQHIESSFHGTIQSESIGSIQFSNVHAAAQKVQRTKSNINSALDDFFLLSMQLKGNGIIAQDGRSTVLQQGNMCMYDSTRPYQLQFDNEFEQLVLKVPRSIAQSLIPISEKVTATKINATEGPGNILANYLTNIYLQKEHLSQASNTNLERITSMLLLDCLTNSTVASESESNRTLMLFRIKSWINKKLNDSSLSITQIAKAMKCSRRLIYLCFEEEATSPHQYIIDQRIEKALSYLQNPIYSSLSISEIADYCGFRNASHFSTCFKKIKGNPPSHFRIIT